MRLSPKVTNNIAQGKAVSAATLGTSQQYVPLPEGEQQVFVAMLSGKKKGHSRKDAMTQRRQKKIRIYFVHPRLISSWRAAENVFSKIRGTGQNLAVTL